MWDWLACAALLQLPVVSAQSGHLFSKHPLIIAHRWATLAEHMVAGVKFHDLP